MIYNTSYFAYRNKNDSSYLYIYYDGYILKTEIIPEFSLDVCYRAKNILEDDFDNVCRHQGTINKEDWELITFDLNITEDIGRYNHQIYYKLYNGNHNMVGIYYVKHYDTAYDAVKYMVDNDKNIEYGEIYCYTTSDKLVKKVAKKK